MKTINFISFTLTLFFIYANCITCAQKEIELKMLNNGYEFNFSIDNWSLVEIVCNSETYLKFSVDGYGLFGEFGKPEIPGYSFNLAVEENLPQFNVYDIVAEKITLTHRIYPRQKPWPVSKIISDRPFFIDKKYYESCGEKDQLIYHSEPYIYRGIKGVHIFINPFYYNPSENSLTIIKSFKVKITADNPVDFSDIVSKTYRKLLKSHFANYCVPETPVKTENYLIITAAEYNNSDLNDFVNYRSSLYNVDVFTTSDAGSSGTAMKSFIQGRYDNPDTRPTYVLFVGNKDYFPYDTEDGSKTYLRYTTMEGSNDDHPDVLLGLFFARSSGAFSNIVTKTIHTETHLDDMTNKMVHYSSFADDSHINDEFANVQAVLEPTLEVVNCLAYQQGATDDDAAAAINSGCRFFTYEGHGFQTGWQGFNALSQINNSIYPFVWSFCCLSGDFSYSSACWCETIIGDDQFGTTSLGSTENSSYNQKACNMGMAKALAWEGITQIGPMFQYGKDFTWDSLGTTYGIKGEKEYHLFGDPALETMHLNITDPYLSLSFISMTITDDDGNGYLDPGETAEITLNASNTGAVASANANVDCTPMGTNAGYVNVATSSVNVGILDPGETQPATFEITTSSSTPIETDVDLSFHLTDGTYSDDLVYVLTIGVDISGFFTLDFEDLVDYTTDFSPWKSYEGDGQNSWQSSDCDFPNEGGAFGFMAFNPSDAGFSLASAHSGVRAGMAICPSDDVTAADDWIISPKILLGTSSSISFWVLSPKPGTWGENYYNVLVSTTDDNPSSFTAIATNEVAPSTWTERNYDLSAYNNQNIHIGIQDVSVGKFMLWIDDINITTNSVYLDGSSVKDQISVFPNPTSGKLNIYISSINEKQIMVNVFDITGKMLKTNKIFPEGKISGVDLSYLKNGIYYLNIVTKERSSTKKITILK